MGPQPVDGSDLLGGPGHAWPSEACVVFSATPSAGRLGDEAASGGGAASCSRPANLAFWTCFGGGRLGKPGEQKPVPAFLQAIQTRYAAAYLAVYSSVRAASHSCTEVRNNTPRVHRPPRQGFMMPWSCAASCRRERGEGCCLRRFEGRQGLAAACGGAAPVMDGRDRRANLPGCLSCKLTGRGPRRSPHV